MKFTLLLFFLFPNLLLVAQNQKVKSQAYDLMLDKLLSNSVQQVSVYQVDSLKTEDWIILDTREKKEYEVSKIKGAKWVGYDDFKLNRVKNIPKDTPVLLYCSVGYRSEKIGEKLKAKGFTKVYNLYGGIFEWKNQGNEVVNVKEIKTDSVHTYNSLWGIWLKQGIKIN